MSMQKCLYFRFAHAFFLFGPLPPKKNCFDQKPDNIGFTIDGRLKIFDFGLAKELRDEGAIEQGGIMLARTYKMLYNKALK